MHPAICQGVPDRHLRQSESAHVCQEIHGQQVTKRKFPSRAAAVLAHCFFASRIGERRGQPMAARVADRLCQAHEPVMVCASILNVRVCAAAPISDVKAAPLSTALTVKVTWRSLLGVGVWLFGFGRQRNFDQSANCLGPSGWNVCACNPRIEICEESRL
jgi:hypothetical protein